MGLQDLPMWRIERAETDSNTPLAALSDNTAPRTALMIALAFELRNMADESFTKDDARNLTMAQLLEVIGDADPTPAA